jgi:hypothetical protein
MSRHRSVLVSPLPQQAPQAQAIHLRAMPLYPLRTVRFCLLVMGIYAALSVLVWSVAH